MEWNYGEVDAPSTFVGEITPDPDSEPFWDELASGRISAQRCDSCSSYRFPPGPYCLNCGSAELQMAPLTSTPTLYSWIVINRPTHPSLPAPYVVAIAEFPEGVRLPGALAVLPGTRALTVGQPLRVGVHRGGPPFVMFETISVDVTDERAEPRTTTGGVPLG